MSCISTSPLPEPRGRIHPPADLAAALRAAIAAQPAAPDDRGAMLARLAHELRLLQNDTPQGGEAMRVLKLARDAVAEARATRH